MAWLQRPARRVQDSPPIAGPAAWRTAWSRDMAGRRRRWEPASSRRAPRDWPCPPPSCPGRAAGGLFPAGRHRSLISGCVCAPTVLTIIPVSIRSPELRCTATESISLADVSSRTSIPFCRSFRNVTQITIYDATPAEGFRLSAKEQCEEADSSTLDRIGGRRAISIRNMPRDFTPPNPPPMTTTVSSRWRASRSVSVAAVFRSCQSNRCP